MIKSAVSLAHMSKDAVIHILINEEITHIIIDLYSVISAFYSL